MALISTLVDNFNDNSFDTGLFTRSSSSAVLEQNGRIEIPTAATNKGITSVASYSMTGDTVQWELINKAGTSVSCIGYGLTSTTGVPANWVGWAYTNNANIGCQKIVSGTRTTVASLTPYDSSVHRYFRMREASGTTYWDWSTDGSSWTNHYSEANPIAVTTVYFNVHCITLFGSTSGIIFDNLNDISATTSTSTSSTSSSISISTSSTSISTSSTSISTSSTSTSTSTSISISTSSTSASTSSTSTSISVSTSSTSRSTSTSSTSSSTSISVSTSTSVSYTTSTSSTSSSISVSTSSTSTSISLSTSTSSTSSSTSRSTSTSSTSSSTSTSRSTSTSSTSSSLSTSSTSTSASETTSTSSTSSSVSTSSTSSSTSSTSTSTTIITSDVPTGTIRKQSVMRTTWRVSRPKFTITKSR